MWSIDYHYNLSRAMFCMFGTSQRADQVALYYFVNWELEDQNVKQVVNLLYAVTKEELCFNLSVSS